MKLGRRLFFKLSLGAAFILNLLNWSAFRIKAEPQVETGHADPRVNERQGFHLGADDDGLSRVFMVEGGSPAENIDKAIEIFGGIESLIGLMDIVVLKPNAQRYNQGMTNTDAMKGFIDQVLSIKGFVGEIIIAENHQYQQDDCCGWTTQNRNGSFNLYELVDHYQKNGHKNVTKYHWHVAGPCEFPLEGNGKGNSRVRGPEDGDGYVWMDDNYYLSPTGRKCLMTYPVFTSNYSGITIDLKNGPWKDGNYLTDRDVRLINFSALNHHGRYAGVSASVKNLMGVVDMTCGFPGDTPEGTFNTHHIGVSQIKHWLYHSHWRVKKLLKPFRLDIIDWCYRDFRYTGGVLGQLMATVKMPDLHIIAAEIVGWGGRKELDMSFRPKALMLSKDPVALDYLAAREILYPSTPDEAKEVAGVSVKWLNNPDDKNGPFNKFLKETEKQGVGTLNFDKIRLIRVSVI
jgi:hypothetical protein